MVGGLEVVGKSGGDEFVVWTWRLECQGKIMSFVSFSYVVFETNIEKVHEAIMRFFVTSSSQVAYVTCCIRCQQQPKPKPMLESPHLDQIPKRKENPSRCMKTFHHV
jgi:hypothetical protein